MGVTLEMHYAQKVRLLAPELPFFGYTLDMGLILKLVAGLIEGLRAYFLLAAAAIAIPCAFFFLVFLVGLVRPSRSKVAGSHQPRNP